MAAEPATNGSPARRVTIADVAREAGVSKATVSRALNSPGAVGAETRSHVLDVVARLGFAPNLNARSLTTGKTQVIGVVVSDIQVPFFTSVARAVQNAAHARGYLTLVGNSDELPATEDALIRAFASRRVDGLIVTPAAGPADALLEVARHIPVVTVDRVIEGVPGACVVSDNYAGSLNATRHVLGLGHRDVAYLSSPLDKSSAVERYRGYRAGLEEAGVPFRPELLRVGDYHADAVEGAARSMLAEHAPTAVLTSEASISVGALRAAQALELRVPDDLSLLGFDDLDWTSPELTVVLQDTERLGREAMTRLLALLDGGADEPPSSDVVRVPTRLKVRASCAPPPSRP